MNSQELLEVTTVIGSLLVEYGAEIYRVEESIERISTAYGYGTDEKNVDVFAIPTCVIVTVNCENEIPITRQKRIMVRGTNLDRVDRLNNLSRYICDKKPPYSEIMECISQIQRRSVYGFPIQLFSYAVVGSTFALFFGGKTADAITSGIIAVIIKLIETAIYQIKPSVFLKSLFCSMIASAIAVITAKIGLTDGYDAVIIGSLMTLVPGITLTNCMRDFIAGDFLAGLYTMTEALLIALGLAVGAAVPIALLTGVFGGVV